MGWTIQESNVKVIYQELINHWQQNIQETTKAMFDMTLGKIGHVTTVVIIGATALVFYFYVKLLQFIWRSGTRTWNLRVPDLQISGKDYKTRYLIG